MPPESILAHLAPRLTTQLENVATDALAHLLLPYPPLADAFREHVSLAGVKLPENIEFKTQARWHDSAIPDLVGIVEHPQGKGHTLFEYDVHQLRFLDRPFQ